MADKIEYDIIINGKKSKASIEGIEQAQNKLGNTVKSSTSIMNSSWLAVGATAATVGYAFKKMSDSIIDSGFDFNKQIEQSTAGIAALALVMQDKSLPVTERMTNANKEAAVVMEKLQEINAKTPHTLDQTNQIYKAMYVSMKNVGASSQEIIDITQKLSVASGAAGIEFSSLLAGVDGLATGTVLANSDLGRFLGSLGLTNEALRGTNDVVRLLNESLDDFKQIDTITTSVSNLNNAWGQLTAGLTKDIFKGIKEGMNQFSNGLNTLDQESLKNLRHSINGFSIAAITSLSGVAKAVAFIADGFESLGARIAGAAYRIENGLILNEAESKALEKMYQKTKDNIQAREEFIKTLDSAAKATINAINQQEKDTDSKIKNTDATKKQSEADAILAARSREKQTEENKALQAEMKAIYAAELLALGYNELGEEIEKTNKSTEKSSSVLEDASKKAIEYGQNILGVADALNSVTDNMGIGTNQVTGFQTIQTPREAWWDSLNPLPKSSVVGDFNMNTGETQQLTDLMYELAKTSKQSLNTQRQTNVILGG